MLSANADSNITFGSNSGYAHGDGTVDDLLLRVVPGALPILDLVRLQAETIGSHADVSFDGSDFALSGGIVIEDATLRVLGVGSLSVLATAVPNTVLLDAAGIRIVLNEQISFNDGTIASLEVNAIRITIDSPLQVVAADITIGHSYAAMTIPTPGTLGMLASTGLLASRRRRRN